MTARTVAGRTAWPTVMFAPATVIVGVEGTVTIGSALIAARLAAHRACAVTVRATAAGRRAPTRANSTGCGAGTVSILSAEDSGPGGTCADLGTVVAWIAAQDVCSVGTMAD